MIRRILVAPLLVIALAGCADPQLSGIATGLKPTPGAPLPSPAEASFAFEPFPGVPGNVGDQLTRSIWRRMEREGLTVQKRPGGAATFHVTGAVTAVSDDTNATVFYVFDVLDPAGRKLHRITGHQTSNDSEGDPWASVNERDLDLVARRLAVLLRAWLHADG